MQTPFGEFLVQQHALDRFQLFRALQLQDRLPKVRLGHCAVALGFVPRDEVELLYVVYERADPLELIETEAFERIEIEIESD